MTYGVVSGMTYGVVSGITYGVVSGMTYGVVRHARLDRASLHSADFHDILQVPDQ